MFMKKVLLGILLGSCLGVFAQPSLSGGQVTGNHETTFQYLNTDTTIGAFAPEQKVVMNSYTNVNYINGKFAAGMRLESYLPAIAGYPAFYSGTGVGYKYLQYNGDFVSFTAGNFYDQFGSGMIFRSYTEPALGLDNVMNGASIKVRPVNGIELKGVYGRQRFNFADGQVIWSEGIVRGLDADVNFNDLIPSFSESKLKITAGASIVSKYQPANNDTLRIPKNVAAYGGRISLRYSGFFMDAEYIHKINDPTQLNGYVYNTGHGALINVGYSRKGLGINLTAKSLDNMVFRSDRVVEGNQLFINYLPATSNMHTYILPGTLYPYAPNFAGEIGYQLDVLYKIPKKTKLGGKYGTDLNLNVSVATDRVRHTSSENFDVDRISYEGRPFDMTDSLFNFDFNLNITRKLNKKWKVAATYYHFIFNNDVNKVTNFASGYIKSDIIVLDVTYKIARKHTLRVEAQNLWTEKDRGDWAAFLAEYTFAPHWFVAVMDQWNYGNSNENQRLHFVLGSVGYLTGNSRIAVSYGKQREGILCIGGVCRPVPATNGLTFNFTHTF